MTFTGIIPTTIAPENYEEFEKEFAQTKLERRFSLLRTKPFFKSRSWNFDQSIAGLMPDAVMTSIQPSNIAQGPNGLANSQTRLSGFKIGQKLVYSKSLESWLLKIIGSSGGYLQVELLITDSDKMLGVRMLKELQELLCEHQN